MHRPVLAAAAAAVLAIPAAAQLSLVVPAGYAATEGNANNPYPWNRGSQSMRIQFVHDGSHFTTQGVAVPVLISRLRYRPDATAASWSGGSWPNVRIEMATCPVDHAAVSATFAANLGPDATVVHQGPVTVQGGTATTSGPQPWHVDIPLATPFLYDPAAGDLTIDIQLDGSGWNGSATLADT
jgi:hypothetical protein